MDQFYTKDDVAERYYAIFSKVVCPDDYDVVLEPSAGKGAFFKLLPEGKRRGIDLDPKCDGVERMDFFEFQAEDNVRYAVIGNPPFGKVSSTAVRFFNKAAEFADAIAFVVPRTFKRASVQNRLDPNFHLAHEEDVPTVPCCFEPKMAAKCCFQVWKRGGSPRTKVAYDKTHEDFGFVKPGPPDAQGRPTPPSAADFALRAYGGNCGEVVRRDGFGALRAKSWHWIEAKIDVENLVGRFASLDFSVSKDTVRQDSMGRKELVFLYGQKYGRFTQN